MRDRPKRERQQQEQSIAQRIGARWREWGGWAVLAATLPMALTGCGPRTPVPGQPIQLTGSIGSLGDSPGRFAYPRALDLEPLGAGPAGGAGEAMLWVIDKTARVQLIDTRSQRCIAMWRMPDSELGKPTGVTIAPGRDGDGRWCEDLVYIPDTHYNRVIVYALPRARIAEFGHGGEVGTAGADATVELQPTEVARFGSFGEGPGQFIYPTDVAVLVAADGQRVERVYVSEYGGNDRISVFDGDFKPIFSFGRFGTGTDSNDVQFNRPQSIAIVVVEGRRELIVTDSRNHRIGRFTLDGELIAWIGQSGENADPTARGADAVPPGGGSEGFNFPWGLADLGDGTVLVSEFGAGRVQRVDLATGEGLGAWGRAGRGEGELATPWALAVRGDRVFVLDSGNNRVVTFRSPSRRLTHAVGASR